MPTVTNILFACDESGAKGYADNREAYPGEVGVFAGILVPDALKSSAEHELQALYRRHRPTAAKVHIVEMTPTQQETLRHDAYEIIGKLDLPCFWYAIHVEGLHSWYVWEKQWLEDARSEAGKRNPNPRIKTGSPRDNPPSMHEQLFAGLYANLLAFLDERHCKRVSIEVRTDKIDSPILESFREDSDRLLATYPHLRKVSAWDTVTKQKVNATITHDVPDTSSISVNIEVTNLSINPLHHGDGFTLAADVLANSLNYLFKTRDESQLYRALNVPSAIRGHPLADNLAAFSNWGNADIVGDTLYSHPNSQQR